MMYYMSETERGSSPKPWTWTQVISRRLVLLHVFLLHRHISLPCLLNFIRHDLSGFFSPQESDAFVHKLLLIPRAFFLCSNDFFTWVAYCWDHHRKSTPMFLLIFSWSPIQVTWHLTLHYKVTCLRIVNCILLWSKYILKSLITFSKCCSSGAIQSIFRKRLDISLSNKVLECQKEMAWMIEKTCGLKLSWSNSLLSLVL